MKATRQDIQKAFRLAEPPDDELMQLLGDLGEGDSVTGVAPVGGPGETAESILGTIERATIERYGDTEKSRRYFARLRKKLGLL